MFAEVIGPLLARIPEQENDPEAPGPLVFAQPGTLAQAMADAGFTDVHEEEATVITTFRGSPKDWWQWLTVLAPPVNTWLEPLSSDERARAMDEVHAALSRYQNGDRVEMPVRVNVARGRKPPNA